MSEVEGSGQLAKEDPAAFVLRAKTRPVVRFRRGLIMGLIGGLLATIFAIAWIALRPHSLRLVSSGGPSAPLGRTIPEALDHAPEAYSDVPRLGPPLPGDLGRPILEQERALSARSSTPAMPSIDADERQRAMLSDLERRRAEELSARTSPLTVRLGPISPEAPAPAAATPDLGSEDDEASRRSDPVRKAAFVRPEGRGSRAEEAPPASALVLSAGTVIPASLITGINSDLPGLVLAQVTENVRDSFSGRATLIPQGARLIGHYDNGVAYGQKRALLVWNRIVFPNGASIDLNKVPATDVAGEAGLTDHVDSHQWQVLKGVVLSSLLGLGSELSLGRGSSLVRALRRSTQQNGAQVGEQLVARDLDVQPTLVVRPGWPVRALLEQDLLLPPWAG